MSGSVVITRPLEQLLKSRHAFVLHRRVISRRDPSPLPDRPDPDRVEQALVNLIGNADKFSPLDGIVLVSAFAEETQVEKGGTGLGLRITRSIVQRHGGRIWVESTYGKGTQFSRCAGHLFGTVSNGSSGHNAYTRTFAA